MLPPSISEMIWHCHCCDVKKPDKYIKVYKHDLSHLHDMESGMFIFNVRYCSDNTECIEKAKNREWLLNKFKLFNN